ncbi:MAG: hypothetical protein ABWY52_07935 [Candidatus Limnocylindrales bacterium]
MGLSVAAILLAVALVAALLAWVRRDLRARGASMRVWWLVFGTYMLAGVVWLIAIVAPLPIAVAWLATIPAAVATIIPERLATPIIGVGGTRRRRRAYDGSRAMAHPVGTRREMAHRTTTPRSPTAGLIRRRRPVEPSAAGREPTSTPRAEPALARPWSGRQRWPPGDLRLAVELLEDAAKIPDLDDAAQQRIEARLGRLDRFKDPDTAELLALVRDDVHARLAAAVPAIDPDPARAQRIAALLDAVDPRPS